jgi:hypothetical protein
LNRRRILPLPCLLLAFALAGCGGGGEEDPGAEIAKIRRAIVEGTTSTDPAACTEFQTQAYTELESGETGHPAVASCEVDRTEGRVAGSATISEVTLESAEASAAVALAGKAIDESIFEGQTLRYTLVREDDGWKLDDLTEFVKLDRGRLNESLVRRFSEPAIPTPRAVVACMTRAVRAAPRRELERYVLQQDSDPSALETQIANCPS